MELGDPGRECIPNSGDSRCKGTQVGLAWEGQMAETQLGDGRGVVVGEVAVVGCSQIFWASKAAGKFGVLLRE